MTDAEKRMLKIKTGSVTRLKKELGLYVEEREKERQRVARMKEEGADSHDVKHAVSLYP
jgi:tubulin-specific chaperone A